MTAEHHQRCAGGYAHATLVSALTLSRADIPLTDCMIEDAARVKCFQTILANRVVFVRAVVHVSRKLQVPWCQVYTTFCQVAISEQDPISIARTIVDGLKLRDISDRLLSPI